MFSWRLFDFCFSCKTSSCYINNYLCLIAWIRLKWILEVLIQLRRRCHRRRFYLHWIFPRPAEFWFEIHPHQRHFSETLFRRNVRMARESFDDLLRLLRGSVQRENTHLRDCCESAQVFCECDGNCKKYSCCVTIWES